MTLTLAIPLVEFLAYYEIRLLDVITLNDGMLMTMWIPLASRQTVFTVYKAKSVPMPQQLEKEYAMRWKIESYFLAVSEYERNRIGHTRSTWKVYWLE